MNVLKFIEMDEFFTHTFMSKKTSFLNSFIENDIF